MSVKSILEIELRDDKFRAFKRLFDQYERSLKSQPEAWRLVNEKIDGTRSSFDKLVSQMAAANVQERLRARAQERADQMTRTTADRWRDISRWTGSAASNIKSATIELLKWSSLTGVIGGLVGAGGIWGIDRLALSAAGQRRSAFGLGTSIGGQNAFSNFGRLVDPDAFLSSVAGAKSDVTRRVGLLGAGLSQGQIEGDTATTAVALLQRLKTIADQTDPALYAQILQARRLDQFASPEDLRRLHATSPGEMNQLIGQYQNRRGSLDLPEDVARKWQDFSTQMTNAGKSIENAFIRGLAPLEPGFEKLSQGVEKTVAALLDHPALKQWLDKADAGLEKFASYVGTPAFQQNVENFVTGIGKMGEKIAWLLSWIPGGGSPAKPNALLNARVHAGLQRRASQSESEVRGRITDAADFAGGLGQQAHDWLYGAFGYPVNNPGNLRMPGQSTGFAHFGSAEEGLAAMASQLRLYGSRDHIDTIAGIIAKYAPSNENDTNAYIKDVAGRTGFGSGQHLNLGDNSVVSRLVAAMINHEQRRGQFERFKDSKTVVEVLNQTGGNSIVSVNGLKN